MPETASRNLALIIDDEPIIRRILKALLGDTFNILEAEDGEEGLDLFIRSSPDIVLLDLYMPAINGLHFLQQARDINPDIPVIVISGAGKKNDIAEALRLGACDYLFKPIESAEALNSSINKALKKAQRTYEKRQYQRRLEHEVEEKTRNLKLSERRYRSLVSNIPVGIFRWKIGQKSSFITSNQAMASILGYDTLTELLLTPPETLLSSKGDWQFFLRELDRHGKIISAEVLVKTKNNKELWTAVSAFIGEGNDGRIIDGVLVDISKRKEAEEKVKQLSFFDTLTNLPNRAMLIYHLRQAISSCRRKSRSGGVIFLGLNRFKVINDSLGHHVGDEVLKKLAETLSSLVRDEDTLARVGGDEFAILFADVTDSEEATGRKLSAIAEKIRHALQAPLLAKGHELYVTAGIGIALFPENGLEAEGILQNSSTASNICKKSEHRSHQFYLPEMQKAADRRIMLERDLRQAIANHELQLYYQPQVNKDGIIVGAEALVRWIHPHDGVISPSSFIPLAEETGVIIPLGNWVLNEVCRQMSLWKQQSLTDSVNHISINVSPRQFRQPEFVDMVENTIRKNLTDPKMLTIEITEGIVISDLEDTISKMKKLRELGISFSIDDFGTGYSSLSYLHRLPLDQLKIDRSFTQGLSRETNSMPIVSTIIVMARNLGFDIVAEGVETEKELSYFTQLECRKIQGFYFSKPLPLEDFTKKLKIGKLPPKN